MRKCTFGHCPAKTQISLGIHTVFTVSLKKAWIHVYPMTIQQRIWSDCAYLIFAINICHKGDFLMLLLKLYRPRADYPFSDQSVHSSLCSISAMYNTLIKLHEYTELDMGLFCQKEYIVYHSCVEENIPYLPKVFGHLNSLPYLFKKFNKNYVQPVVVSWIAGWLANSVDLDEMRHSVSSGLGLHCLLRPVCLKN